MKRTYDASKIEEARGHSDLKAAGHPRFGNKKGKCELTWEMLLDLRKARIFADNVKHEDFFQGSLF